MLTGLRRLGSLRRLLAGIACIVSIPAVLQLVGGWNDAGILEEWGLFELFSRRGPQFWLSTSSAISSQALRPLSAFPGSVAYHLGPDSFHWHHIVHAAFLSLRCAFMVLLLRELRFSHRVCVTVGLVFTLFPAWSGIFLFRTTHFQMASALVTMAAWLLVRSKERTSWPKWW